MHHPVLEQEFMLQFVALSSLRQPHIALPALRNPAPGCHFFLPAAQVGIRVLHFRLHRLQVVRSSKIGEFQHRHMLPDFFPFHFVIPDCNCVVPCSSMLRVDPFSAGFPAILYVCVGDCCVKFRCHFEGPLSAIHTAAFSGFSWTPLWL